MKPTLIRNKIIHNASHFVRSKQLCSHLSKELQQKYSTRSVRVTEGDTVRVMRGEFKGVTGKVTKVSTENNSVAIEGIKREKLKGGNVDVFIHTSNVLVTDLNTEDKWRQSKLEGRKPKEAKEKQVTPQQPQQEPTQLVEQKTKELKPKTVKEKPKKTRAEAEVKPSKKEKSKDTKQKDTKSKKVDS